MEWFEGLPSHCLRSYLPNNRRVTRRVTIIVEGKGEEYFPCSAERTVAATLAIVVTKFWKELGDNRASPQEEPTGYPERMSSLSPSVRGTSSSIRIRL